MGVSQRRAVKEIGIARSTHRHVSERQDDSQLRSKIIDLTATRRHFGYRRITWLLQQKGNAINHKRVYWI